MRTIHQFQSDFLDYLNSATIKEGPKELYGPVNYIMKLGGKRLRPVVLLMSYGLFSNDYQKAMPAAMAIEVFHNFTLVHDDIMDKAPLRRGKPTVHEKYDLNTGILSGDVMLVKAYQHLLKLSSAPNFTEVLEVFTQTCVEVCEGQQMDMNFETRPKVTIEEYLKMIELKTSVLVAGAMKMGALLAGAPTDEAEMIYEFGRNLGIAFQIQDDLLDTFGDPEKFGKKVGGDIAQNKKTFLYLKALELATDQQRGQLAGWYERVGFDETEKIKAVVEIFNELKIKDLVGAEKKNFEIQAMRNLERLQRKGRDVSSMEALAEQLMGREQ